MPQFKSNPNLYQRKYNSLIKMTIVYIFYFLFLKIKSFIQNIRILIPKSRNLSYALFIYIYFFLFHNFKNLKKFLKF